MRALRLSFAAVAILAAAACSDQQSPTGAAPGAPRFDAGGGMVGSGNRGDSTATAPRVSSAAGDTTGAADLGGGMVGSGN